MIIKLPYIEPINTLALTEDFEEQVKTSFAKFTDGTNKNYTHEDKLLYLDNLRKRYIHKDIDGEDAVKQLILDRAEFELDEYGDLPSKDDFWSLEFMGFCYDEGKSIDFRDDYGENSGSDRDKTLKAIAKIIQIVMNWEAENG